MYLDVYSFSNCGGRSVNEDSSLAIERENGSGLFIVADGLGGHGSGEEASGLVVNTFKTAWEEEGFPPELDRQRWLMNTVGKANSAILQLQKATGKSMKSTAVALVIDQGRVSYCHIGDSRLYYIMDGRIKRLTDDHSVTFKKYLSGEISLCQINNDVDRSSLLRAIGDEECCFPESGALRKPMKDSDGFLLCSDGAWEYLFEEEILVDFLKSDSAEDWGYALLLRIMERIVEHTDNLTIITGMMKSGWDCL